jgi:hypothetical protein
MFNCPPGFRGAAHVGLLRQHLGIPWNHQHIIKGQGFKGIEQVFIHKLPPKR